jgi:hypothetical protein
MHKASPADQVAPDFFGAKGSDLVPVQADGTKIARNCLNLMGSLLFPDKAPLKN